MANWKHKLDVSDLFHDDSLTVTEKGAAIAERLKDGPWMPSEEDDPYDEVLCLVEELAQVDDEQYFNEVWAAIYDWADADHRLWLNVWPSSSDASR